ncbi:GerAB/ArcD/ProY family transporter [Paludifilum halophilum]|uniref:Uncharacterized protein n=1 Tax=Paludifilum halophilum TaxID=1642702 RepID=A0A235B3D7_9BACL|nr:endospore germination permease [Paludifilum halophilum]OYD06417.1 hypothetical protein CHM34_16105 [Paludifilum halophilum]
MRTRDQNGNPSEKRDQNDQPISTYQSHALLVNTLIGVGILSFQRGLAEEVGFDSLWVILIGGGLVWIEVWFLTRMMEKFPRQTFVEVLCRLLGSKRIPWLGRVLSLPFLLLISVYWVVGIGSVSRTFGENVITAVLPRTPIEVTMLLMIATVAVVASNRIQTIARFNEFLLPILYLPIPLLLAALIQWGEWENILPLFQTGWKEIMRGAFTAFFSYSGFSVLFIYMAYYQQPFRAIRSHSTAIGFVTLSYWTVMISSLFVFGGYELPDLVWPTLALIKAAEIPGMFLERLESAILSIWVVVVFTTMVSLFAAWVDLVVSVLRLDEHWRKWVAWGTVPVLYLVASWPGNLDQVFTLNDWLGKFEMASVLLILLILWLLGWIRGNRGRNRTAGTKNKDGKNGGKSHAPTSS